MSDTPFNSATRARTSPLRLQRWHMNAAPYLDHLPQDPVVDRPSFHGCSPSAVAFSSSTVWTFPRACQVAAVEVATIDIKGLEVAAVEVAAGQVVAGPATAVALSSERGSLPATPIDRTISLVRRSDGSRRYAGRLGSGRLERAAKPSEGSTMKKRNKSIERHFSDPVTYLKIVHHFAAFHHCLNTVDPSQTANNSASTAASSADAKSKPRQLPKERTDRGSHRAGRE